MKRHRRSRSLLSEKFTVKLDDSNKNPGWKFSEQEMRGIPVRIEIGPKDIEAGQAVIVRRDNREKTVVSLDNITEAVGEILEKMQADMLAKATAHRDANTHEAHNWEEFTDILTRKQDSSKLCGVATEPVRKRSRMRPVQQPDVCRLSRSICPMSVYIAVSQQRLWYTLARHTKRNIGY